MSDAAREKVSARILEWPRQFGIKTRNLVADARYRMGLEPDFISHELNTLKEQDRARRQTARIHFMSWVLLFLLIAILAVGVRLLTGWRPGPANVTNTYQSLQLIDQKMTVFDGRLTAITKDFTNVENDIETLRQTIVDASSRDAALEVRLQALLAKLELHAVGGSSTTTMAVEQWSSGEFGPGAYECGAGMNDSSTPCDLKSDNTVASGGNASVVKTLLDPTTGPAIVFIVGGHDRTPLTAELRKKVGTNIQLAQLRADSVRASLESQLQAKSPHPVWFISVPRGSRDSAVPRGSDRTVVVSIVRMGKA